MICLPAVPKTRRSRGLMAIRAWLTCLAVCSLVPACAPPVTRTAEGDDPKLVQEILRRQEQRVVVARAEVTQLESELRLVRMRRRMLERAGRHDLASSLEMEEWGLVVRLGQAEAALADEEDALVIYRRGGERPAGA